MMRIEIKVIALSIVAGLFLWVADAILDFYFFYSGTFWDLLIFNIPRHELYIRLVILTSFIIFGVIISKIIARLNKETNALRQSENNVSTILNNTHDLVVRLDSDYRHIFANPSVYSANGFTPEQYLGKTNKEIGFPETLCGFWRKKHEKVFASGQPDYFEFSFDTVNKGKRVFQAAVSPQFNEKNEVETIISVMRDITDLRNAESEIKTLRGIIPICSYCKKIRDDKGAWDIIEAYICKHSEAQFSHGICPECYKKMEDVD